MIQDEPASPHESHWPGFEKLTHVQALLDQNKLLIIEIDHNHELKTPESLQRNVLLLKQLNLNIAKIMGLYQDLSGLVEAPAADAMEQQE